MISIPDEVVSEHKNAEENFAVLYFNMVISKILQNGIFSLDTISVFEEF